MDKTGRRQPLRSTLAGDPDYAELIEMFVTELPDRVSAIEAAVSSSDSRRLRTIAHQLKGAAAGYGFEPIGDAAARVEAGIDADAADGLAHVINDTQALIDLCRSAADGAEPE